ncbi:hypothetical protein [Endomicrobium proavitum]|uniref:Uncharacterized protein n=1 Tax=Endomicrobium proavitum TaxID=1408281 RepID=A0A0G3WG79_9BACT|nr:hypothetical protein [Endomicrobium proavitum]AKL97641.1 exported protein of unknown function [Endomicrobium proavitum]
MKKTAIALCAIFLTAGFAFAATKDFDKKISKEDKAKFEQVKKERAAYFKNIETLVEKYNKAADTDKAAVKAEIKKSVTAQTEKDLSNRKAMLAEQKKRIAKFESQITKMEKDKESYINKKVDFLTTPDGQKKLKEFKKHDKK